MRLRRRSDGMIRDLRAGMVFGRLAAADWQVDDPSVSRRHARVAKEGETWLIEDLNSSNGTFLNGVRGQKLAIRAGDLVTLGAVAFDVLAAVEVAEARPAPRAAPAAAAEDAGAAEQEAAAAEAAAQRERARLQAQLRRPERSRGIGDLAQQSAGMKLLALLLGLAVLAAVALGVRFAARTF